MKFFLLAVLVAVASADDGIYRPEHHGGSYDHQSGKYIHQDVPYSHQSGQYVHQAVPYNHQAGKYVHQVPQTVVVPQRFVQPVVAQQQYVQPSVPRTSYNNEGHWQILRDQREQSPAGPDFVYEYETENKIHAREQQQAVAPESQRATGFYEYVNPEGQTVRVDYIADENGFQPTGTHLPVAPEVPAAIARSVEYQLRNARV